MYECEAENEFKITKSFIIIDGKINLFFIEIKLKS
jgi:hypothetical protein